MSLRMTLLAAAIAACFQITSLAGWTASASAEDPDAQQFQMPIVHETIQPTGASLLDAPPPAPPIDSTGGTYAPVVSSPAPSSFPGTCESCQPQAVACDGGSGGYVCASGGCPGACPATGYCGACSDRSFHDELHYYFSKGCRCRSTCDMYPHYPYAPEYGGYYYFRPYNWRHVLMQKSIAPLLGEAPHTPYATTAFDRIYERVLPAGYDVEDQPQALPVSPRMEGRLPKLESLLRDDDGNEATTPST